MAQSQPRIKIVGGDLDGTEFVLKPGENRIGRVAENEIVLRDRSISRRHAVIRLSGGRYLIQDLGSHNGIEVGGSKVDQVVLTHGLEFRLGDFQIVYSNEGEAGGADTSSSQALAKVVPKKDQPAIPSDWQKLFGEGTKTAEVQKSDAVEAEALADGDLFGEEEEEGGEGAGDDEPETAAGRGGLILFIAVLLFVIITGLVILHKQSSRPIWPRYPDYIMKKKESRVFYFRNYYRSLFVENEDVVEAKPIKFIPRNEQEGLLFVQVTARGPGVSKVVARPRREILRFIVRQKMVDDEDEGGPGDLSKEQRLHKGRLLIRSGASSLQKEHYPDALKDFSEAERILYPIRAQTTSYVEAKQRKRDCQAIITERVNNYKQEYLLAKKTDPEKANVALIRILRLIPDHNDPQHQITRHILNFRLGRAR